MNLEAQSEAERQQRLLDALWRHKHALPETAGLRAYRANAGAAAERALAAACPTVQQLMGEDSFAALARALWHHAPPDRGDLAQWGADLPAFLAADPALSGEPYLADVARVDLALHRAESAADAALDPATLQRLAEHPPETLRLRLAPGAALVVSPHPVATIVNAHRSATEDRFAPVRAAFAAGQGEAAFVWRRGWRGDVAALDASEAAFVQALLAGADLAAALDAAPGLDFETWLGRALSDAWLAAIDLTPPETP
jgi:Putative DNA-binding domain